MDAIADAEPKVEPLARAANNPYTVFGQRYMPFTRFQAYRERGVASWYGRKFHGQKTSSGEPYDMYAMTAAHTVLPIPSYARVTNPANGKSVIVRVNDRGPFHSARVIDLSYTAAWKLGYAAAGSATVEVEAITPEEIPLIAARKNGPPPVEIVRAAPPAQPQPGEPIDAAPTAPPAKPQPDVAIDPTPAEPPPAQASAPVIPIEPGAGGVYLQLGAFSARDNAENLRAKIQQQLAWLNQAIEIFPKDGLFRLHLGPYRDRGEATGIAERIREALELKPMIVVR